MKWLLLLLFSSVLAVVTCCVRDIFELLVSHCRGVVESQV